MKKNILIALFATVTMTGWAQEKHSNPGWLWEISGNGLAQKSYLFGTSHGEGHNYTDEEIYGSIYGLSDALNEVEAVFFEASKDPKKQIEANPEDIEKDWELIRKIVKPGPEFMMPEGVYYKPLFDSVSHFNEFNKFMTFKIKDPEYWKKTPSYWLIRMSLYLFDKPRANVRTVDFALHEECQKRGKEEGGLESEAFRRSKLLPMYVQTGVIDSMSMKEQVKLIYNMMKICDNDSTTENNTLYKGYLDNDTCRFQRYFASFLQAGTDKIKETKGEEVYKKAVEAQKEVEDYESQHLLLERNEAWIPVIERNIAARPCMIAVGCRHLLGSNGLITMLRRKGYAVEPVKGKK